ncbi:MAG: hypothetical protein AB7P03_18590 [Kofleriaceae bacterium]
MRTALAISAAAHVVAVTGALVWSWTHASNDTPLADPIAIEIVDVPASTPAGRSKDAAPAASADEPTPPVRPEPARQLVPRRDSGSVEVPATDAPRPPDAAPAPAPAPTEPSRWFDMRRPRLDPATQIRERFDALDHVPAGTDAQHDIVTGELSPAGGGRMRSNQGPFIAHVDRDGSVDLKDNKNFQFRVKLPTAKDVGNVVQDWYYDPNKPVGLLGQVKSDGTVKPEGRSKWDDKDGTVPLVGGSFDISDAIMRRGGQDPYASQKLRFLDATRDERAQIGARHRARQLADATRLVKRNLDRLWAQTKDPQARRQALFEMWDECAETGTTELVEAGRAARRMIVGFIRARLPVGSAAGYSAGHLEQLNRRKRSIERFSPYSE